MKKYKYLLIILLIIAFNCNAKNTVSNNQNTLGDTSIIKGDVNGDGKIDVADYVLIRKYLIKIVTLDDAQKDRADTNYDNIINPADYNYVRRTILYGATKYSIVFDSNGGSSVTTQKVDNGGQAKTPTKPTRKGYIFLEWQLDGKEYNFNNPVSKDIKLVAVWIKFDKTTYNMKTNGEETIKTIIEPSSSSVNLTYSVANDVYASVDNTGTIHADSAGNTTIAVKGNNKDIGKVEVIVDYGFFDSCSTSKSDTKYSLKTNKGRNVNIYACLENQIWTNLHQGLAVTNDSVIYTGSSYKTWCTKDNYYSIKKYGLSGDCNSQDYGVAILTSGNYIRKINKKTGKYINNYIDVGGHGQAFDATYNNELYINYFAKVHENQTYGYGASNAGIAYISKFGNDKDFIYPTKAIRIRKNGNFDIIKSSYSYGTLDYLKDIIDKANGNDITDKTNGNGPMLSIQHAIDEDNDLLAVIDGEWTNGNKVLYIYDLSDFLEGNTKKALLGKYYIPATMCGSGKVSCFQQGIEVYGDYVYSVHDMNIDGKHYEGIGKIKYKEENCKSGAKKNKCGDMEEIVIPGDQIGTEYVKVKNGYEKKVVGLSEFEGISIYKGKIYASLITNYFNDGRRRITTVLVDGF